MRSSFLKPLHSFSVVLFGYVCETKSKLRFCIITLHKVKSLNAVPHKPPHNHRKDSRNCSEYFRPSLSLLPSSRLLKYVKFSLSIAAITLRNAPSLLNVFMSIPNSSRSLSSASIAGGKHYIVSSFERGIPSTISGMLLSSRCNSSMKYLTSFTYTDFALLGEHISMRYCERLRLS